MVVTMLWTDAPSDTPCGYGNVVVVVVIILLLIAIIIIILLY